MKIEKEKRVSLKALFSEYIKTECCRINDISAVLYPEEMIFVKNAVDKRKKEFAAGRICARRALNHLGFENCLLLKQDDGSIMWPPGITGTVSHSDIWCGAAVARCDDVKGIGLDIETVERIKLNIARMILTAREKMWLNNMPADDAQKWLAVIFSAKEALFKAMSGIVNKRIGFHDSIVIPSKKNQTFDVILGNNRLVPPSLGLSVAGRYFINDGSVFTGIICLTNKTN